MFHTGVHRSSLGSLPSDSSQAAKIPLSEAIGCLAVPSPVRELAVEGRGELWVKDDGAIHPLYGGNKARKLWRLIADARLAGARRLVTVGAAGSHHVLATALWGREVGLPTCAVLASRPWSDHAEQTLLTTIATGAELVPLGRLRDIPSALLSIRRRKDYFIPAGGSNLVGAEGYFDAGLELLEQVQRGEVPPPDFVVVATGSGGTAAGLLASLARAPFPVVLVGVGVVGVPGLGTYVRHLANRLAKKAGGPLPGDHRFVLDRRWLGKGYGHATDEALEAIEIARAFDLCLETTYTGKAFAASLAWLRGSPPRGNVPAPSGCIGRPPRVLYWGTLSRTAPSPPASTSCNDLARLLRRT
jgi:1-aminocyclopropane-1-carboxylate deaminase/D-cysteine desulfhydrase-like pyridoxal-dependent ACC family enzyme